MTLSGDGTITGLVAGGLPDATITTDELAAGAALNNAPNSVGFRNRIINGDMRIDQRNAGAAVTASVAFPVDRFLVSNTTDGAFSAQQDSSAPTGFKYSTKVTVTTADASLTTVQLLAVRQNVEGYNIDDLGFGAAGAKTITLSFWVRSSETGTFGGAIRNSAANRSYVFTYSISSADTWEQKSVTIAGDTTGTWLTTNGIGFQLVFSLGAGPDLVGTAGSWQASNLQNTSGTVSLVGTLDATWQITGVQLEVGSVATPFERRPYGTELALCQRYFQVSAVDGMFISVSNSSGSSCPFNAPLSVPLRTTPSSTTTEVSMEDFRGGTSSTRNISSFTYIENSSGVRVNLARLGTSASQSIRYITSSNIPFSAEL